ncbi:hypothetical protein ACJX0J_030983, partial [Zea mays]
MRKIHRRSVPGGVWFFLVGMRSRSLFTLNLVWVQFTGLPKELREYLVIWVDMVFTRKWKLNWHVEALGGIQEVTGIAGNNLDDLPSKGNNDTFVKINEKEVEEEEDIQDESFGIIMGLKISGGMLLGVDLDVFDIGAIEEGDFFIKMVSSGLLFFFISEFELGWFFWDGFLIYKLDEIGKRAESVPLSTSEAKNRIFQMHNGDRMLYEDRELKGHITRSSFTLDEDFRDDIIQTFSEEESCFLRVMGTKRGAREDRLFHITWDVICQPKELGGGLMMIKDLFMSKGTFQAKDGSQTAKIPLSSFGIGAPSFIWRLGNILDQVTFGLVIGGLTSMFLFFYLQQYTSRMIFLILCYAIIHVISLINKSIFNLDSGRAVHWVEGATPVDKL